MLALAQKLHDEHVRSGEEKRDQLIREAEAHAARLVNEAEQKQRETLGSLERERSLLERKIDELRAFERDYRARLKSYLESQLRDLESKGSIVPGRGQAGAAEPGFGFGSPA
jgi:cell division septum initiation protein DivIVA